MLSPAYRRALLIAALLAVALLIPSAASAIAPSSTITSPSSPYLPFFEGSSTVTISGTANNFAEPEVEIRCYTGPGEEEFATIAEEVPIEAGETFSVLAPSNAFPPQLCQLRAVPEGAELALPPGVAGNFEGPLVATSEFRSTSSTNFLGFASSLAGGMQFESAGNYAMESDLYSASAHASERLYFGVADLNATPPIGGRSTIVVDGADGYGPLSGAGLEAKLKAEATTEKKAFTPIGVPALSTTHSYSPTGQLTIKEQDPIDKCAPGGAEYPPKFASETCTHLLSTGVTLERTWQATNEDHVAWLTDTWRSSDGAAHSVNSRYYTEIFSTETGPGAYEFPGQASFAKTKTKQAFAIPSGPGMILYKTSPSASEVGDGEHPQGAIAYDLAPNEPIVFARGSEEPQDSVSEIPYQRTVTPSAPAILRMAFAQSFSLGEARSLAEGALASYRPTVAITAPAAGATVSTPSVTVSGTASDTGLLASVTVNGTAAALANGTWSTTVALNPGANRITATATDEAGLTSTATETVTYTPPPPAPPTAKQLGVLSGAKGKVTFTLVCEGPAGSSCHVSVALSTIEKLKHGKLVGVVASHTRSKKVTIGGLSLTIPAGERVKITVSLNRTGRKLLARFHKLPAHVTATLTNTTTKTTVISQNLTIKPTPKKHKH